MITSAERPLPVRFLRFLGPLVLTNVLNALSGTLNIIFLGQLLGAASMAAAVGFFPAFMFLIAFVIGLGTGASVLVGQAHGAREPDKVREVAGAVLLGGVWLGVLVGVAGAAFARPLMHWLGTPPEILADSVSYARVMLLGLPVFFTNMLVAAVLRGMGDSLTPLRMLMVSFAVSAVVTPALMVGWFGLPRLGVASAGWGTLLGTLTALVWLAWRLHRQAHILAWSDLLPHLRLSRRLLTVARLGVPTALFFITSAAADMGLLALVNDLKGCSPSSFKRLHEGLNLRALKTSEGFVSIKAGISLISLDTDALPIAPETIIERAAALLPSAYSTGRIVPLRLKQSA